MTAGNYVYVGKSKVRTLKKERKRRRATERKKNRPPSGGSPDLGKFRYSPLPPNGSDSEDIPNDCEADSTSTGSSEVEDLLPLLDLDIALDLRPHYEKHSPSLKMPFQLFKRKEKKKQENVQDEMSRREVKDESNGEVNGEFKQDVKDPVTNDKEPVKPESTTEPIQSDQKRPVKEESGPKPVAKEPENEKETIKEATKEEVEVDKALEVQSNGKPNEPLTLDKYEASKEEHNNFVCCTIL